MSKVQVPSAGEILRWPVTVDVPTAGRCWGLGRDAAYGLARLGQFPVPVLRLGASLRVTRASVLAALGIAENSGPAPYQTPDKAAFPQLNGVASSFRSDAHASPGAA